MSVSFLLQAATLTSPGLPETQLLRGEGADTSPAEGEEQLGLRQEIWNGSEELRLFREQKLSRDLDEEQKMKLSHPHA